MHSIVYVVCEVNWFQWIHSFISIQPLGWFSRNQATGMALVHCILDTFLGVGCHYFPPPLDVPTFSARGLHVQRRERPLAAEGGTPCGREMSAISSTTLNFHVVVEIFYTCRRSTTWDRRLYFPSEGRRAEDFFTLKNPTALARFEPANLGTKGQHATCRPPKPLSVNIWY
jgi:hypothetical protein